MHQHFWLNLEISLRDPAFIELLSKSSQYPKSSLNRWSQERAHCVKNFGDSVVTRWSDSQPVTRVEHNLLILRIEGNRLLRYLNSSRTELMLDFFKRWQMHTDSCLVLCFYILTRSRKEQATARKGYLLAKKQLLAHRPHHAFKLTQ